MAAKLLHSLADDNPDLHKQMGCMTGIFQMFDRHNMIGGRRIGPKRLPPAPGHSHSNCGNSVSTVHHREKGIESSLNEDVNEKQRVATESSRDSISSCSSSLSSVDYNKTAQIEASSVSKVNCLESPSMGSQTNRLSNYSHSERQPFDLRNVVKDSMHREVRTLSVKSTNKDDSSQVTKYRDFGRPPTYMSKGANTSSVVAMNQKHDVPIDIDESLRVLAKLRDSPWNISEGTGFPRSSSGNEVKYGNLNSNFEDSPRRSFDGRERYQLSSDTRNFTSSPKLKELPRLSLDSRENLGYGFSSVSVKTPHSKKFQDGSCTIDKASDLHRYCGNQKRPAGVVAKLMGLETLPDSSLAADSQFSGGSFVKLLESRNLKTSFQTSASNKTSSKCPTSPQWKNPDLITKPIPGSRLLIETAPWRKSDGAQVLKRSGFRPVRDSATNSFPSVYGEIEMRLNDLEFKQSGKDLRALKQILEKIQTKALIDNRMEKQASNFGNPRDQEPKSVSPSRNARLMNQQNRRSSRVVASTTESSKGYESPIVIMRPGKLVEKSGVPASSISPMDQFPGLHKLQNEKVQDSKKDSINSQTKARPPKNSRKDSAVITAEKRSISRNVRSPQSSKSQPVLKENSTNSIKSSDSISPRLRHKKVELEKKIHPTTPPSDSNKPKRTSKQTVTNSQCGKMKQKSSNVRQCDDQSSEMSNESRNLSFQSDDMTQQSDTNLSFESKMDIEVNCHAQVLDINGNQGQAMKADELLSPRSVKKLSTMTSSEDGSIIEQGTISPEHPSPVSVLDASFSSYRDDETSPIKPIRSTFKGGDCLDSNKGLGEDQCNLADSIHDNTRGLNHNLETDNKKFRNIDDLVRKLRCLNSQHNEAETDYIASLCENTNPDDRYISEILLASGLLLQDLSSGLTTFQLHSSGYPINPELFCVLEKTKGSNVLTKEGFGPHRAASHPKSSTDRFHRKLIFDAVNEILVGKLALISSVPEPWMKPKKLTKKTLNGQKILKELCCEIVQFQAKKSGCSLDEENDDLKSILQDDVMRLSGSWTECHGEISDVVLDVERSIFKDLVNELIIW